MLVRSPCPLHIFSYMHQTYCYSNLSSVWFQTGHIFLTPPLLLLTFADEPLLGDGLLAYVTTLGLLEWLQLERVCVDALQLLRLRRDRKRDGDVELEPKETVLGFVGELRFWSTGVTCISVTSCFLSFISPQNVIWT